MTVGANWNCPECKAANAPGIRVCEYCGYERPVVSVGRPVTELPGDAIPCSICGPLRRKYDKPANWVSITHCARCGDHSESTTEFLTDTKIVADRGVRLCPGCRILALKRRAEADPPSPAQLAVAKRTLAAFWATAEARRLNEEKRTRGVEVLRLP